MNVGHEPPFYARRTEPGRLGFGWRAFMTCGYECNSVQGVLGPAIFWIFFDFYDRS